MKIAIENHIIETENIYQISAITYSGVGHNVFMVAPFTTYFTVHLYNSKELRFEFNIYNVYKNISGESSTDFIKRIILESKSPEFGEKYIIPLNKKVEAMRNKIIEYWQGHQLSIPQIKFNEE